MSAHGAPEAQELDGRGLKIGIVASSWHEQVMAGLVDGASHACKRAGVEFSVIRVPGAFELPVMAAKVAETSDAVVALGVVIQGGTPHFTFVCNAATEGLVRVSLDSKKPVGFGLLTCDSDEQAMARAGLEGSIENKGEEAALAAIETALKLRDLP